MVNLVKRSENRIDILELKNDSLSVTVTNLGCTVMKILTADKDGRFRDMVLGYDTIQEYQEHTGYLGAFVGRVANRIGGASFELNGKTYQLAKNSGPNAIHGGIEGFSNKVFSYTTGEDEIVFTYTSPDGEEGYPGELNVTVTYRLEADKFILQYEAHTDQDTILNFTNHSYFNLDGDAGSNAEHLLTIDADYYTPVDSTFMTTGEIVPVEDTPMDFRTPMPVGERINDTAFVQIKNGKGYDHNWVLNAKGDINRRAASLKSQKTGIVLDVYTNEPGVQVYAGNFLDGSLTGKKGITYNQRASVCLETQKYPDTPNKPEWPSAVLRPGEKYMSQCIFKFSVDKE